MVTMEKLRDGLAEGIPARAIPTLTDDEKRALPGLQLLPGNLCFMCVMYQRMMPFPAIA